MRKTNKTNTAAKSKTLSSTLLWGKKIYWIPTGPKVPDEGHIITPSVFHQDSQPYRGTHRAVTRGDWHSPNEETTLTTHGVHRAAVQASASLGQRRPGGPWRGSLRLAHNITLSTRAASLRLVHNITLSTSTGSPRLGHNITLSTPAGSPRLLLLGMWDVRKNGDPQRQSTWSGCQDPLQLQRKENQEVKSLLSFSSSPMFPMGHLCWEPVLLLPLSPHNKEKCIWD